MMKVWMVIYISGKIVGAIGPLPYDVAECEIRKETIIGHIDTGFAENADALAKTDPDLKRDDIEVVCVEQEERPVIEDADVIRLDGEADK